MTTYKEINGANIEVVASDPSNPVEGQIWFNTTNNVVKGLFNDTAGSWSTGGALNTKRYGGASAGIQTAAFFAGGQKAPGLANETELYNGTNWTEVNNINTSRRYFPGVGTTTAGLIFNGTPPDTGKTESYNGTNWTEVNDLNTARRGSAGAGTNTAALGFGGYAPPGQFKNETELWNGTNWTEVNNLNTGRSYLAGAGTQTAALAFGGSASGNDKNETEVWNGTNWTEVNNLNTARSKPGSAGTQTSALAFGGSADGLTAATETWNGTNWTNVANMATARSLVGGAGASNTSGLVFGGDPVGPTGSLTEEWIVGLATVTFTDA